MIHPLDPRSPQYATLVAAGRVRERSPEVELVPDLACTYEGEERHGPVVCARPAPFVIGRADGTLTVHRLCDRDLGNYVTPSSGFVVARIACSVCDATFGARYELDHDGRCNGCRP